MRKIKHTPNTCKALSICLDCEDYYSKEFSNRDTVILKLVEVLELDKRLESFDCIHYAEEQCKCGSDERKMYEKYRQSRDEALAYAKENVK